MFQPMQKQSFIKRNSTASSNGFEDIMNQSFMLQQSQVSDSFNEQDISDVKDFLNDEGKTIEDFQIFLQRVRDMLSNETGNEFLDKIEKNFIQNFDEGDLTVLFEFMLTDAETILNSSEIDILKQLQNNLTGSDSEELEDISKLELIQLLTKLQFVMDETEEGDELKVEDIVISDVMELDEVAESELIQLFTQLQSVMSAMKQGESPEKLARILLPLLNEWASISKQFSKETLHEFATKFMDIEEFEILKNVQELYEKRTHFQSKQMYGENATVTRADVAQWIKAALNQRHNQEQTHRVIPTLDNEMITMPRMSIVNQQSIHQFNQLESVQRIEAEMTTRIANIIQQQMSLQQRGPMQSLSMVLTPDHLGTLQVNFSQVNGEMLVRIIASSGYAKEMLESNLHQLKHVFSPHQVQIVRADDTVIEDALQQQEDEELEEHEEHHDEQQDETKEEQITLDFSSLFEEILEEEVVESD